MAEPAETAKLESRVAALGKSGAGVDPADIAEVVESVLESVSGDKSGISQQLHEEIEALANFIRAAKSDISSLGADEINTKFIPAASDELSAIVGATEHATNEIFEAVEAIEAVGGGLEAGQADPINTAVTQIYEACSFQDITGQRIGKIVKVLEEVEAKVADLLHVFGEGDPDRKPKTESGSKAESETHTLTDEELMSGPQLAGNAMSQEDIDALMASFD